MKVVRTFKELGWINVEYESDVFDGEYLDTKVSIGEKLLCWIEGNKISEFHEKLEDIINKYRI